MAQAAATRFDSPWGSFQLQRYPSRRQDPLRAWCAADQLLLDACRHEGLGGKQVGVANDDHGALTLPLQPAWCWTDSALSRYAIEANLRRNGLPAVPIAWSTQCPGTVVDAVVLRIPKQIPYLEYQLALLAGWLPAGTLLLAGGMDKHLSPHTAALIERSFGPTTRHRGPR